ncbi:flagellar brake protein [Ferrigenium sp. UT5]|uniref:flagellar brake protein n=1 Tax=Ferrigenium sp. UT5 TaxID=3242105 RepID=UPI0035509773
MRNKEVPLKIEVVTRDEENDFILHDPKEILAVLRDIAARRSRVALYYNEDNSMVLTLLLAVDETGLWVDAAASPIDNRHIERSRRIVFVSTHNQAKVQWVSTETTQGLFQNMPAFFLPLPRKLLRLQRRNYYRLLNSEPDALKCYIHAHPHPARQRHEMTVLDLSIGGVALVCVANDVQLEVGKRYTDCEIDLPGIGSIHPVIEVRSLFEVTSRSGEVSRRAGCEFYQPDSDTVMKLQRYVAQMQQQLAQKQRTE